MQLDSHTAVVEAQTSPALRPTKARWAGRVVSGLVVGMLIFSAIMKFGRSEGVVKEFDRLGYGERHAIGLGILELACAIVYAIPQTAPLGAIVLTGYLGGATATHVRIGDAFIGPVIGGMLVWLGLLLREPRLKALLPLRKLPPR